MRIATHTAAKQGGSASVSLNEVAFGRHFTATELAEIWRLDETTIRRLFQDEPGVLKIGKSNRRDGKRDYVTLRIPEAVALRVWQERTT
jgi:hypothetical protein